MSAWGAGIFEDDTACDLREEFLELLTEGHDAEAATTILEKRHQPAADRIDVEPVFWIALAAIQHQCGRLTPGVRDTALGIIDSGQDLERFLDDAQIRDARAKVLLKLKADLLGPRRPPRQARKAITVSTAWTLGQIFRYRLASGRTCLFRVVGHQQDTGGRYAIFEVLHEPSTSRHGPLRMALMPGARNRSGQFQRIIVPSGLETSPRISRTELGQSVLALFAQRVRDWLLGRCHLPGSTATSVMVPAQLDRNLKSFFDLD